MEASQLFSYAKELSECDQLDEPEIEVNVNVPCKHKTHVLVSCMCIFNRSFQLHFFLLVDSISDVLTVRQIKTRVQKSLDAFYGVIYGFISTLGLDSCITKVIRSRW